MVFLYNIINEFPFGQVVATPHVQRSNLQILEAPKFVLLWLFSLDLITFLQAFLLRFDRIAMIFKFLSPF